MQKLYLRGGKGIGSDISVDESKSDAVNGIDKHICIGTCSSSSCCSIVIKDIDLSSSSSLNCDIECIDLKYSANVSQYLRKIHDGFRKIFCVLLLQLQKDGLFKTNRQPLFAVVARIGKRLLFFLTFWVS